LLLLAKEYYWAVNNSWRDGKLAGLGMPYAGYSPILDGLAAMLTASLYLLQILRYGCRQNPGLLLAAFLLLVAYPLVPNVWLTAANLDCRLPVFAVLLLMSGLAPNGPIGRPVWIGAVLLAAVLAGRAGVVAFAWADGVENIAECRQVILLVQPGERVLVVGGAAAASEASFTQRMLYSPQSGSLAPLLTIDRQAFWPSLFTSRTLQPVHVVPPYLAISVEQAEMPSYRALTRPTPRDLSLNPYLKDWRFEFDYVLVLQPGSLPPEQELPADGLKALKLNDICSLYAIDR
jgi:hypothetical protein